ncbi:MAG: reprolysin-like metallopeptidase [Chloroflexota bacterium]
MRKIVWQSLVVGLCALALLLAAASARAQEGGQTAGQIWTDIPAQQLAARGRPALQAGIGRTLALDRAALAGLLAQAPLERLGQTALAESGVEIVVPLPLPDGSMQRFTVIESPVMAPELAAKYPQIRTYIARSLDDPQVSGRIDLTPLGFHAYLHTPNGRVLIDPAVIGSDEVYLSYNRADAADQLGSQFSELPPLKRPGLQDAEPDSVSAAPQSVSAAPTSIGDKLRIYRLAVSATGEYTAYFGGTRAGGQAAIVTAINRINDIYEREIDVRLVLVSGNDQLVFTNADTDPFTNNSGTSMLSENQSKIDAVIGPGNYDFGHVFSTGGSGVAYQGVICEAGWKAKGVTGSSDPVGDPFVVDYVAHEMGHQLSGDHTFNGSTGSCSGRNRESTYAYEPGSGSTIMSYAGICSGQNLQSNSDAYFHSASFSQIANFVVNGQGKSCGSLVSTGNSAPAIGAFAYNGVYIPKNTPFTLTGSASDADALIYNWEQLDAGPVAGGPPGGSSPVAPPHFRSFTPTSSPSRTFPKLSSLLANTASLGEALPSSATALHFRFTARDNRTGGGGVSNATYTINVASSGPFVVTSPSSDGVSWAAASSQSVTWDPAGTAGSPVNCSNVKIELSTDGGNSYGSVLAASTANDGSHTVTMPALRATNTTARVRVSCVNNVFFDISNKNFEIYVPPSPNLTLTLKPSPVLPGRTLTYNLKVSNPTGGTITSVQVVQNLPAGVTFQSATSGCSHVDGVVTCTQASLAGASSKTFSVIVTVNPGVTGVISSDATLTSSPADSYLPDNEASLDTQVYSDLLSLPLIRN